jgi:hypothetical protein
MTPENLLAPPPSSVPLRRGVPGRAQPPQDPAKRAELQDAIADAQHHAFRPFRFGRAAHLTAGASGPV